LKPVKKNPYNVFYDWLFSNSEMPFPEECLKVISKRAILSAFSKHSNLTILLNSCFNNYYFTKLDDVEFFEFLKNDVIRKYNPNRYKLAFFKSTKKDKDIKHLHKYMPHLKKYELDYLFEAAKEDEDFESLLEALGLLKSKKRKLTKEEKKNLKNNITDTTLVPVEQKQNKTMDDLMNDFLV
jgi:hypothetical protein